MKRAPCNNPKSETESDLCAQWRAAKAAEKSADWTEWGVLASIAGISLLLWQIMLTREAVQDTGRATDAMKNANEIALMDRRPWINFEISEAEIEHAEHVSQYSNGAAWSSIGEIGKGPIGIKCMILVKNIGKSPAYDVQYYCMQLKGEWRLANKSETGAHNAAGYFAKLFENSSGITVAALLPEESGRMSNTAYLDDDTLSEQFGPFRAFPKFAMFARYKGVGINGIAETGKVFLHFGPDDILFDPFDGVDRHGQKAKVIADDYVTHIT